MEKDEIAKLLALLKKINELVKTSYTTNNPCILLRNQGLLELPLRGLKPLELP